MNPGKPRQRTTHIRAARLFTNVLNPFCVFTALYALVAMGEASVPQATLYVAVELAAAAFVAGYVFLLRRRRRVGDFWLSGRRQRLVPALVLLSTFVALLGVLTLIGAPVTLFLTTLSMGLASAAIAVTTLVWKASAHSAVSGHASVVGLLVLGPPGLLFALVLPAVLWARVAAGDHTPAQALTGAGIGAIFAAAFLV
jgi:hypothetical protein